MGHLGRRRRPNFWNNIDRIDRPLSFSYIKVFAIQGFDDWSSPATILWHKKNSFQRNDDHLRMRSEGREDLNCAAAIGQILRSRSSSWFLSGLLQLIPCIILPNLWRQSYQSMRAHLSRAAASLHKISVWLNEGKPLRKKMYFYEQCSPQHVRILRNGGVILVIYTAG